MRRHTTWALPQLLLWEILGLTLRLWIQFLYFGKIGFGLEILETQWYIIYFHDGCFLFCFPLKSKTFNLYILSYHLKVKTRKNHKVEQISPWIRLAKDNGKRPPPCPMHKMCIFFFPCSALMISKLHEDIVIKPVDTILFTYARWH